MASLEEKKNVGILLFDMVEVLDFAGPFEVFSRTRLVPGTESRRSDDSAPFNVFTIGKDSETLGAWNTKYHEGKSKRVLLSMDIQGVPKGIVGIQHLYRELDLLKSIHKPSEMVVSDLRIVDSQRGYVSSAGISAGIDAALYIVQKLCSIEVAADVARYMEYKWNPQERYER